MRKNIRCIIMGAAGRDFHDFQTFFREHPQFHVVAFTATQIPFIASRSFPRSLAGPEYEADIPIYPEEQLAELIDRYDVDFVFLAYSDISHLEVMHKASLVQANGAGFVLLGPKQTQLEATKPVISVTATRTGAGKSPVTQWLARQIVSKGYRVGVIRHPMPYGDLSKQVVERFSSFDDLDRYECTVEEREEYEPYLEAGLVIYAGVDYREILAEATKTSDVILWDGGNNDYSFYRAGLSIVIVDALRPGHELEYYPGETNFHAADILVLNKVGGARQEDLHQIRQRAARLNPTAELLAADLEIDVDEPLALAGKRVLVVEDGPTLTHGGMAYGAGTLAARQFGASDLVDPRSVAVGSIAEAFRMYPHLEKVLPALGYSPQQRHELAETIRNCGADLILDASPASLSRVLDLDLPIVRVRYRFQQVAGPDLGELVARFLEESTLKS